MNNFFASTEVSYPTEHYAKGDLVSFFHHGFIGSLTDTLRKLAKAFPNCFHNLPDEEEHVLRYARIIVNALSPKNCSRTFWELARKAKSNEFECLNLIPRGQVEFSYYDLQRSRMMTTLDCLYKRMKYTQDATAQEHCSTAVGSWSAVIFELRSLAEELEGLDLSDAKRGPSPNPENGPSDHTVNVNLDKDVKPEEDPEAEIDLGDSSPNIKPPRPKKEEDFSSSREEDILERVRKNFAKIGTPISEKMTRLPKTAEELERAFRNGEFSPYHLNSFDAEEQVKELLDKASNIVGDVFSSVFSKKK